MPLHFSDLKIPDPACGIDPSAAAAKAHLRETLKQLVKLHRRSTEWWRLNPHQQRVETAILGSWRYPPRNGLAANVGARYAVGSRAIDMFDAEQREHPQRRYALVTLISDRWITLDRHPTLYLGGIKAATRQVLRLGRFDGWVAV